MRIAVVLFDGAEELDFVGPWEVLAYWAQQVTEAEVEIVTVAASLDPVRAAKGMRVLPDRTWDDVGPIDVLVMPGGKGTRPLITPHEPLHERLRDLADAGTLMTSVCTGSLVFAAAGLLKDRPATTHYDSLDLMRWLDSSIDLRPDARFVDDGNVVTAAGVSAGIDMALHLVVRLDSEDAARAVRREIQYAPQPPI
jgi:transcriptional regulator GlxA family with amidase domain